MFEDGDVPLVYGSKVDEDALLRGALGVGVGCSL